MVLRLGELGKNFADSEEESDVSLYHDVSTAPLLDLRRRLKAVVDLLSAMIRGGVSLARSVELAVLWDGILRVGPIHPTTAEDFLLAKGEDLGQCLSGSAGSSPQAFGFYSCVWLCIVEMRLVVVGEDGCGKIHLFILTSGFGLSWSFLLLLCSVILLLLRGDSGVLAGPCED